MAAFGIADEAARLIEQGGAPLLRERLPDAWLDQFAIVGDPGACAASIAALAEAGADAVALVPLLERTDEQIAAIARDVLPRLG